MSVEHHLRHELRKEVASDWAHMEELVREALNATSGSEEQTIALLAAADWAQECADNYDMGEEVA